MPAGVEDFEITDIQVIEGQWALGKVMFRRDHFLPDDVEVTDILTVKVRVSLPEDGTIEGLHEALYRQAVDTLAHTAARCEGRSAQELQTDAHRQILEDRQSLQAWK